jgi:hypothetical protein
MTTADDLSDAILSLGSSRVAPEPEKIRTILLSHSIDNVFDYCPRKFEFLNVFDKRPPRDSGFAASVGTALHEGTQAYLIARAEGLGEKRATEAAFMSLYKFYPWEDEFEQYTQARSWDKTTLMLYRIIRSPEWDEWELVSVEGRGWAIEVPWLIRHTSVGPFRLKSTGEWVQLATQGKIDFVLRHVRTGVILTRDLKTTILDAGMVRSEYTFSGQQVGYSNVVHAMIGVTPEKMEFEYLVARFSATEEPEIQLVPMVKGQDMIEDYWFTKLDRLYRIKNYAEAGWFPRTNGSCNSWGKECAMFDICHSRDYNLIQDWFRDSNAEPQQGYDYWVELEV